MDLQQCEKLIISSPNDETVLECDNQHEILATKCKLF